MAKTRHIHQRMSQRSIHQSMLDMVKVFGVNHGEKTILNKKGIENVLNELNRISKTIKKMHSRGGFVLIEDGDTEITAYAINSYKTR